MGRGRSGAIVSGAGRASLQRSLFLEEHRPQVYQRTSCGPCAKICACSVVCSIAPAEHEALHLLLSSEAPLPNALKLRLRLLGLWPREGQIKGKKRLRVLQPTAPV